MQMIDITLTTMMMSNELMRVHGLELRVTRAPSWSQACRWGAMASAWWPGFCPWGLTGHSPKR